MMQTIWEQIGATAAHTNVTINIAGCCAIDSLHTALVPLSTSQITWQIV